MYQVASSNISDVAVEGTAIIPVDEPGSQLESYFFLGDHYHITDGLVYPTALDAFMGAQASTFTLTSAGSVGFYIPNIPIGDNSGGLSLSVNAVPIPGAVWMVGSGLLGLVGLRRKFQK